MAQTTDRSKGPTGREIFGTRSKATMFNDKTDVVRVETSLSGAQSRPFIPRLRSDPPPYKPLPKNLVEFREQEGREERKRRLRSLWKQLPKPDSHASSTDRAITVTDRVSLTPEKAETLKHMYEDELLGTCGSHISGQLTGPIEWKEFRDYALAKEVGAYRTIMFIFPSSTNLPFRTMDHFP